MLFGLLQCGMVLRSQRNQQLSANQGIQRIAKIARPLMPSFSAATPPRIAAPTTSAIRPKIEGGFANHPKGRDKSEVDEMPSQIIGYYSALKEKPGALSME